MQQTTVTQTPAMPGQGQKGDAPGLWREPLIDRCSIEATTKEIARWSAGFDRVPPHTNVFIPQLPGTTFRETLDAAGQLHRHGLRPVPHVTARATPDAATLADQLAQLVSDAGVEEILLIAGSRSVPVGHFSDTLQVLDSGVVQAAGLKALFMGAHPEGHPDAAETELDRALCAKNAFAIQERIPVTLVTQFFFDAGPVIAWERRIRRAGNRLPIFPGLHGVTGTAKLLKHAVACGIGASLDVLRKRSSSLLRLTQVSAPDDLLAALSSARDDDHDCLFAGVHLFPLGGLDRTIDWITAEQSSQPTDH